MKSQMAATDVLINIALGIGGGLVGAAVCDSDDGAVQGSCVSGFASFVPFILSSRTVSYSCNGPALGQASPSLLPQDSDTEHAALSSSLRLK